LLVFCDLVDQLVVGEEAAEEVEARMRALALSSRLTPHGWETLIRKALEVIERVPCRGLAVARLLHWAADAQGEAIWRAQTGLLLAYACNRCREFGEAALQARRTAVLFKALGDVAARGLCELELGVAAYLQGWHGRALDHLRRARLFLTEARAHSELARVDRWIAAVYADKGELDEAAAWCQAALRRCRKHAVGVLERTRCNLLGALIAIYRNDYVEAVALLRPLFSLLKREGYSFELAHGHKLMGLALTQQKLYAEAEGNLLKAHRVYAAARVEYEVGICERALAILYAKSGRLSQAMEHISRAMDIFRALGHELALARCMHALGSVHLRFARYQEAVEAYRQAADFFEARELEVEAIVGRLNEAQALEQLGHYHEALAIYEKGRGVLQRRGLDVYLAHCLEHMAEIHKRLGHHRLARRLYRQAKVLYEIRGIMTSAAACETALATL